MAISTPVPSPGSAANAVRDLGIADHLRLGLAELIALLHEAERNTSAAWSTDDIRREMVAADALDILAIGPDFSRAETGWRALIAAEARNWYGRDTWIAATREVLVWAFRAWAVSRVPSPMPPRLGDQLTAWANPDLPPALRRATSAKALAEVRP